MFLKAKSYISVHFSKLFAQIVSNVVLYCHGSIEFLHVKPGKGAAFVRTKVRNYITGNTVDKTFRAGSTVIS